MEPKLVATGQVQEEITWERAEELFPGCSAEWDEMCIVGGDYCPPDGVDTEVRIWHVGPSPLGDGTYRLVVTQRAEQHRFTRQWWRHPDGTWNSPMPMIDDDAFMLISPRDYSCAGDRPYLIEITKSP